MADNEKTSSDIWNVPSDESQKFWGDLETDPLGHRQALRDMADNYNEKEDLSNIWEKIRRAPEKVVEAMTSIAETAVKNLKQIKGGPPIPSEITGGPPIPSEITGGPPIPSEITGGPPIPSEIKGGPPIPSEIKSDPPIPSEIKSDPLLYKLEPTIPSEIKSNNKTFFQSLSIPTHIKLFGPHAFRHQISTSLSQATQPKITEKDFSDQDLKVLKEVLSRPHLISPHPDKIPVDNDDTRKWKKEGYKYIRLKDQPKGGTSVDDKDKKSAHASGRLLRELPSSLTASINGLWYKHNDDGSISIKDRYDFDPKDLSFPNILGVALGARETPGKVSSGNLVDITLW